MLDDSLRTQLQSYLGRMTRPIVLVATLDDTDASRELQALLEDVVSLSTLITLEKREADGSVRSPSFSVIALARIPASALPASRWGTSSRRSCWRCCTPAGTRPRSMHP